MRLKDRVAIVTGGGVGIGKAYAHGLATEGAKVVVADIQEEEAKKVAADIKAAGGEAIAVAVDVTSPEKTQTMAAATLKAYGRIDILVNNAGLYSALKKKNFMEIDTDEWDRVMAVNVKGLFLCVKAVYPAMKQQQKGKIINISSNVALTGNPNYIHYVTSKGALIAMTRAMAKELGDWNICVNSVSPGFVVTEGRQVDPEYEKIRAQQRSLKKTQVESDLVVTVLFLSSNESDFMTGQLLNVDGGFHFVG